MKKSNLLALPVLFASIACGSGDGTDDIPSYGDDASGLETLFEDLDAARTSGDTSTAAQLTRSMFPDENALDLALRSDANEVRNRVVSNFETFAAADEAQLADLFGGSEDQTKFLVHAATTEEIAEYAEGSTAFEEFPGGANELAQSALAEGVTFFELERRAPGAEHGVRYHLFFHDGTTWRTLGPAWRSF